MPETTKELRAHPRVCGENSTPRSVATVWAGSSPRVRGKRREPHQGPRHLGLIPACAGKTNRSTPGRKELPAHPRVCGENRGVMTAPNQGGGSSPRVRGKRPVRLNAPPPLGLIPACAGKTAEYPADYYGRRAHPRVCGENFTGPPARVRRRGSSPRVRGKRGAGEFAVAVCGLIPACAGKTMRGPYNYVNERAHPRVCGENGVAAGECLCFGGSSPRVRGKQLSGN